MDEITVSNQNALNMMPVMDISQAIERRNAMVQFVKSIMTEGTDFGIIPGTGDKPTLLKPGAEKLTTFFGLSKRFVILEKIEDWTGKDHDGEPFFYYLYRCQLYRGDTLIAEADGSCNSMESKYRWRWVKEEDVPPELDKSKLLKRSGTISEFEFAIEKADTGGKYGKPIEYWQRFKDAMASGNYRRFQKKTKNGKSYPAIEIGSDLYRIPNSDIASQVNTIQKMAQKRALVAATLLAVNASEFFTQDLEDIVDMPPTVQPHTAFVDSEPVYRARVNNIVDAEFRESNDRNVASGKPDFVTWFRDHTRENKAALVSSGWQGAIRGHLGKLADGDRDAIIDFLSYVTGREIKTSSDLLPAEWQALLDWLKITENPETKEWYVANPKARGTFWQIVKLAQRERGQLDLIDDTEAVMAEARAA